MQDILLSRHTANINKRFFITGKFTSALFGSDPVALRIFHLCVISDEFRMKSEEEE